MRILLGTMYIEYSPATLLFAVRSSSLSLPSFGLVMRTIKELQHDPAVLIEGAAQLDWIIESPRALCRRALEAPSASAPREYFERPPLYQQRRS